MSWKQGYTIAPVAGGGVRVPAYRCTDPNCMRVRVGAKPMKPCPHWREPVPPIPLEVPA